MEDPIKPRGLMRVDPNKKIADEEWPGIRHMIESGVPYKEVAERFNVKPHTLRRRASEEKWLTPQRLAMAKNGTLKADDPANVVAELWRQRGAETRDMVYTGAAKALQRFFALSPVPQSFSEAAIANKMLKEAIDPSGALENNSNVSIQILANQSFKPTPVVDV
jgi:hypothetical protein